MATRQYCALTALVSLFCVAGGLPAAESNRCVLAYDFNEGQGLVAKDSSGFHNDALGLGFEADPFWNHCHWQADGGISNSQMFIRQSVALQPSSFLIEFEIKPEKRSRVQNVFMQYVTPFYYKGPKINHTNDVFWPMFYPLRIRLTPDDNLLIDLSMEENGVIARKSFASRQKLPVGQYVSVGIKLADGRLSILLDGKEDKSWPIAGQICYRSPEHYDGHVNAMLGSSGFRILYSSSQPCEGIVNGMPGAWGFRGSIKRFSITDLALSLIHISEPTRPY